MRHAIGAQRIELRQAQLQRVKAEQIGSPHDRCVPVSRASNGPAG
jgi:hypothetical protein